MNDAANPTLVAIQVRRAEIARQREALDVEDHELTTAERVVRRLAPSTRASSLVELINSASGQTFKTQSDMIIATLGGAVPPWVESSGALHDEIERIHGVDIKSGSLLPLLTTLKNNGTIIRDGPRIALASRVVEFERDEKSRVLIRRVHVPAPVTVSPGESLEGDETA